MRHKNTLFVAVAIWMTPIFLWGAVLATVTGGLGLWGISGWNGETGGNDLALLGMPLLMGAMNFPQPLGWVIGGLAQLAVCMVPVVIVRGIIHLVRR